MQRRIHPRHGMHVALLCHRLYTASAPQSRVRIANTTASSPPSSSSGSSPSGSTTSTGGRSNTSTRTPATPPTHAPTTSSLVIPKTARARRLTRDRFSIDDPKSAGSATAGTPPPPAWMLRHFPHFFQREPHHAADEHGQPMGAVGVYGYLVMLVITFGVVVAHVYERWFTDAVRLARAAQLEKHVMYEMEAIRKERREAAGAAVAAAEAAAMVVGTGTITVTEPVHNRG